MLLLLLVTILVPLSEGQSSSCSDLHCHSINVAFKRCPAEAAIKITSASVKKRFSSAQCRKNWSYGIDVGGKSIWVKYGCRALFEVCAIYAITSTTPDTLPTTFAISTRSAISKSKSVSQISTTSMTVTTATTTTILTPTIFYSAISANTTKHPVTTSAISKPTTAKSVSTMFMPSTVTTSTILTTKRKPVYYGIITTALSLPMTFITTTVINGTSLALPVSTTISPPKTKPVSTASRTPRYPATTTTTGHMSITRTSTRAYTKTVSNVPTSTKTIASSNFSRTLVYSATSVAITTVLVSSTSTAGSAPYTLVTGLPVSTAIIPSSLKLVLTPVSTMQPSAVVSMRVAFKTLNDELNGASGSISIAFDSNFIAGAIVSGLGLLALGGTCACILLVHVTYNRVSPTTGRK